MQPFERPFLRAFFNQEKEERKKENIARQEAAVALNARAGEILKWIKLINREMPPKRPQGKKKLWKRAYRGALRESYGKRPAVTREVSIEQEILAVHEPEPKPSRKHAALRQILRSSRIIRRGIPRTR